MSDSTDQTPSGEWVCGWTDEGANCQAGDPCDPVTCGYISPPAVPPAPDDHDGHTINLGPPAPSSGETEPRCGHCRDTGHAGGDPLDPNECGWCDVAPVPAPSSGSPEADERTDTIRVRWTTHGMTDPDWGYHLRMGGLDAEEVTDLVPPAPSPVDEPDELTRLRRWKAEATIVLDQWDAVHEALGSPGLIGDHKSAASLAAIERMLADEEDRAEGLRIVLVNLLTQAMRVNDRVLDRDLILACNMAHVALTAAAAADRGGEQHG